MARNHLEAPLCLLRFGDPDHGSHASKGHRDGLGVGVSVDPAASVLAGSERPCERAGGRNTSFLVDPVTRLVGLFMSLSDPFAGKASAGSTGRASARH